MHFCVLKLPASAQKSAICSLADDYRTIECIQSEQKFVSSFITVYLQRYHLHGNEQLRHNEEGNSVTCPAIQCDLEFRTIFFYTLNLTIFLIIFNVLHILSS